MSAGKRRSKVRLIGLLIIVAGALGVVAAGVTLGMVSAELKAEHLTVTAMTREGPGRAPLVDPFKAYAPAGMDRGTSKDVMAFSGARDSTANGSFLRALFTIAAVALGVAAPVMGIGVLFALVDHGASKGSRKR
jgi:hypothetical protein